MLHLFLGGTEIRGYCYVMSRTYKRNHTHKQNIRAFIVKKKIKILYAHRESTEANNYKTQSLAGVYFC